MEVVGSDTFMVKKKTLWHTIDYHSKFPIAKKVSGLSADGLVQMAKLIFTEYELPKKTVSDAGTNLMSEMFTEFCRR